MRWSGAIITIILLGSAMPAIGSFHEALGTVADREFLLVMQGTSFNGLHAPEAPLLEAYLGETVRFTVVAAESHTFHVHGHPWLLASGRIVDTFLVAPDTPHAFDVTAGGPDRHPGDWLYHCHIDSHMEGGMWGIFRVYPFMTRAAQIDNTIAVTLERVGERLDGATLTLSVDGEPILAHVTPLGKGEYAVHADLPAAGVLVVTAEHAKHGESVARLGLGGASVPAQLVSHAHDA